MPYPQVVREVPLTDLLLTTNSLKGTSVSVSDEAGTCRLLVAQGDELLLRLGVHVCPTVDAAQEAMMREFTEMSRRIVLECRTNEVGDVMFYRNYGGRGDRMSFTRNNVYVSIRSNSPLCLATNVACHVDAAILRDSRGPGR